MFEKISAGLVLAAWVVCGASPPWKKPDAAHWSAQDVEQVLSNSPWAQVTGASFALAGDDSAASPTVEAPQAAGIPSPHNAATDGRWDGGVARVNRNGPPTLNITVRWESALPVREALARQGSPAGFPAEQLRKDYIIAVLGLVPGGRYGSPKLKSGSSSDESSDENGKARSAGDEDKQNPEEMLENIMRYSRLFPHSGPGLRPENARLDAATGTLYLFFPRSDEELTAHNKEITFQTRFGSLTVVQKFRLRDMLYGGRLEL